MPSSLQPIAVDSAESVLRSLVEGARSGGADMTLARAWPVFKKFLAIPVAAAEDGVLIQYGVYSFSGPEQFLFGLVRQFQVDIDGEYDRLEQLQLNLHFEPSEELRALGSDSGWWFPYDGVALEEFLDDWLARPATRRVWNRPPSDVTLFQEQV